MRVVLVCALAMFALLALGAWLLVVGEDRTAFLSLTLAVLPIAIMFYRMRGRHRLVYGAFEFLISLGGFYFLLWKLDSMDPFLARMLAMFVAIYFMVEALEDIGSGLTGTRLEGSWKRLFGNAG